MGKSLRGDYQPQLLSGRVWITTDGDFLRDTWQNEFRTQKTQLSLFSGVCGDVSSLCVPSSLNFKGKSFTHL